jgi:hypothetical protein
MGAGAVRVDVEGSLPKAELVEAIALRVRVSTAAEDVVRVVARGDAVEITHRGRVRRMTLGRSTDLGRRIALAVSDLIRDPITLTLPPIDDAPAAPVDIGSVPRSCLHSRSAPFRSRSG